MPITFNSIPGDLQVPGTLVEYDGAKAISGPQIKPFKVLMVGQKLATGTQGTNDPVQVTSVEQGRALFGANSMLHGMIAAYLRNPHEFDLTVVALDDAGGGVASTLAMTVAATNASPGSIYLYIAGRRIVTAVAQGDTSAIIGPNMVTAINATENLPVTAAFAGGTNVNLTARNKGAIGNEIDVRINYNVGEALPVGVTMTNVPSPMAGGSNNPNVGSATWSAIGELQYDVFVMPYTDAVNYASVDAELASRWTPPRQIDSWAISAKRDTQTNLSTYGAALNSKHIGVIGVASMIDPPWEMAAMAGAQLSYEMKNDPVRPMRTIRLFGAHAPTRKQQFTYAERDLLLRDGISTLNYGPGGEVYFERAITGYQVNGAGAPDKAYNDAQTMFTNSYIRWDLVRRFETKYPRHKIAGDTIRIASGQAIITPKVAKAEMIGAFLDYESIGMVEDIEQFKKDLVAEVNAGDPTRMDIIAPFNLVNPFHHCAIKIEFRL